MTEDNGLIHSLNVLRQSFSGDHSNLEIARAITQYLNAVFQAGRVELFIESKAENLSLINNDMVTVDKLWMDPKLENADSIFVSDLSKVRLSPEFKQLLAREKVKSFARVPIFCGSDLIGTISIFSFENYRRWQRFESLLLESIANLCAVLLSEKKHEHLYEDFSNLNVDDQLLETSIRSKRLLEYGNLIIVRTDESGAISEVHGDTQAVLGYPSEELLGFGSVWNRIIHKEDYKRLTKKLKLMKGKPSELSEEIRLLSKYGQSQRWILLRAVPIFHDNKFSGWEGFGLDISEKKTNEEEINAQKVRIQALYEVARSLVINLDPAVVTLKGLKALIRATKSDSGLGCFYDETSGKLELVAAEGLSQNYIDQAVQLIEGGISLVRYAVENKQGMLIDNIQEDPRAASDLAKNEGLESTIVIPLIFESQVLGAIVTFCKQRNKYTEDDFDLVAAASSQIALALKQAETYQDEKETAESIGTLYRLSHELAKAMAPEDIASHAFPILQEEVSCKRMWLGIINEQGTHLVGKGGFGPGIRKGVIDIQIELDLQHDFLDQAIQTKRPVIVETSQKMECSGLTRLVKRLELGSIVIVPLVSLGQVVGVFIIEPSIGSRAFLERKIALLSNMASEMASVILARRFEARMADADKMRMAGLLASGVAHNFNNMLQAVMGQASLIEMQLPQDSNLLESARTIIDSASKGASLVKQLLSFSADISNEREIIHVGKMLSDSKEFYKSVVGANIHLEIHIDEELLPISADYSGIQHALTNLVVNAKEAVIAGNGSFVKVHASLMRIRSGEVDPQLSPGKYVRIDVEDDGIGLNQEQLRRCFEPFYTTKNVDSSTGIGFEGSGLGLSSAYSIIRQHDGMIKVRSMPKEGTVFSIYIPSAHVISKEIQSGETQELMESVIFNIGEESIHTVKQTLSSL
ncbi:MAG: GAF domain-containing protein, partial [Bdellovibrionales bacterium]|nr:GAF domain-containing protein [Bdellovibrionales bacterium]